MVSERWCSIGGGFIVPEALVGDPVLEDDDTDPPFPFRTGAQLLAICGCHGLSIAAGDARQRKRARHRRRARRLSRPRHRRDDDRHRPRHADRRHPARPAQVLRRARALRQKLDGDRFRNRLAPHSIMDHVSLFAIAVNVEEQRLAAAASSRRRPTVRRAWCPRCCAIIATSGPARTAPGCTTSC
ncbi:hypothetical protein AB5I41_03320 [Sphingomonas sp. MMS24-JH45]